MTAANAFVSCTPDTELQMALGQPVCFREGMSPICSLGIDCHSNNSSDIMTQMRLGLQAERGRRNQTLIENGRAPKKLDLTVQDVFRLGTIQGARALKMEDLIGSLEVGKLADIVIFDAQTPAMICATEHDPIAAIVHHSSIRDIEAVIVDGQFRKRDSKLMPVDIPRQISDFEKNQAEWKDIAAQLLKTRDVIHEKAQKIDHSEARIGLMAIYGSDITNLV
jgi:cytosine/adenosine deaminase-related metal-dependent hydrolase